MAMKASNSGGCDVDRDGFYSDLADGLHAMAQPLTILRSAIAMLGLAAETDEARRQRNVEISARQIDRACSLFASLQNLVAAKMEAANSATMDLQVLLSRVREGLTTAYEEQGVSIMVSPEGTVPEVVGDAQRTELAIAALLEAALSVSGRGEKVEIGVSESGGFCEISTLAAPSSRGRLNSGELLHLAVAKANMLSQEGRYTFADEPLRVKISLPVSKAEPHKEKVLLEVFAVSS